MNHDYKASFKNNTVHRGLQAKAKRLQQFEIFSAFSLNKKIK